MGAEGFHAGRQAGITKVMAAFRNFANEPKTWHCLYGFTDFILQLSLLVSRESRDNAIGVI
jgi:hypothetical protein